MIIKAQQILGHWDLGTLMIGCSSRSTSYVSFSFLALRFPGKFQLVLEQKSLVIKQVNLLYLLNIRYPIVMTMTVSMTKVTMASIGTLPPGPGFGGTVVGLMVGDGLSHSNTEQSLKMLR